MLKKNQWYTWQVYEFDGTPFWCETPYQNKKTALKAAKDYCKQNPQYTGIYVDLIDDREGNLDSTTVINVEWRNAGDDFIGLPGDVAPCDGWFNCV